MRRVVQWAVVPIVSFLIEKHTDTSGVRLAVLYYIFWILIPHFLSSTVSGLKLSNRNTRASVVEPIFPLVLLLSEIRPPILIHNLHLLLQYALYELLG